MIRSISKIFLYLTLIVGFSLPALAQEETEKKEPGYFFNSFLDWVVLSYATYTGELDAEAGSVFSKLIERYREDERLGPLLENINESLIEGGLEAQSQEFFRQTGIRLYFVGEFDDVEKVGYLRHYNVLFQEKLEQKTTPYILVTAHLSGNNKAGYRVNVSVEGSSQINLRKYNLNKQDESNPFWGVVQQNISGRNTFGGAIREQLINGITTLREVVSEDFLPPLLISVRDDWYKSGETIEIGGGAGGTVTLLAIDRDGQEPQDTVIWTISPDTAFITEPVIVGNRLDFPLDVGGQFDVTATSGSDEVSVVLDIVDVELNLDYILSELLQEVLQPLFEAERERLEQLALDSLNAWAESLEKAQELEAYNYPIEEGSNELISLLDEPRTLSGADTTFFNTDPLRKETMEKIRKRKKLTFDLQKGRKLVSFVRGAVQNRDSLQIILDDMLDNVGTVIGELAVSLINGTAREEAKVIITDYLNENLSRLAGQDVDISEIQPLAIVPANQIPDAYDPSKNYYINPKLPYTQQQFDTLENRIIQYQAGQANPPFVVVNYSQDLSIESYLARAPAGVPKGQASGQDYVVISYVNIPGSIKEAIVSDDPKEAKKILDGSEAEDESALYPDADIVRNVLENLRCAYVNKQIAKIDLSQEQTDASNVLLLDQTEYDQISIRRVDTYNTLLIDPSQEPAIRIGYGEAKYLRFSSTDGGYLEIRVTEEGNELAESFDYIRPTEIVWANQVVDEINSISTQINIGVEDNDYYKNRLYAIGECGLEILSGKDKFKVVKLLTNEWRVVGEEEELIVNIIKSITDQANAIEFLDLLKADNSGLLNELRVSIDGENYKHLHSALTQVFFKSKTATIDIEIKDFEDKISNIERLGYNGWKDKNVFYWLNPGFIKRFTETGTHYLRYSDLKIADNGQLSFNIEHTALILSFTDIDVSIEPFELIRIQLLTSSKDLENGSVKGYYYLPAFSIALLMNEQSWDEFNQAINSAFIIGTLGSGVLASGTRTALIEGFFVSLNVASLVIDDYRVELSQSENGKAFLQTWEVFNAALAIWQVSKVVVALPRAYKNLQNAYRNLKSSNPSSANKIKEGVDEALTKAEDAFPSIKTSTAAAKLDDLFDGYSMLKSFSNSLDDATKLKVYDAVKDMNGASLTKLNRGLKATQTGDAIHSGFSELIVKLSKDHPAGLQRLASTNWTDDMIQTLRGKLGRSEYPGILDDLSDPVLLDGAEKMLKDPINAKVYYDELLESNLSSASLERLSKSQFFNELKNLANAHESAVTEIARSGSRAPFSTWKSEGYIHHGQFYLKRVAEKFTGTPKQTVGGGKIIIGDDVHVVKHFDDDGIFDYHRAKINDSKYRDTSPWTPNQKSELINRFKDNSNLEYIEFEVRSELSRYPNTPFTQTNKKVRIYREDVFKTTSDGNGTINPTTRVF